MKPEYNQVHVKMGKMSKAVDASKVEVDGTPLGDMLTELRLLRGAYEQLGETLKDKVIVDRKDTLIVDISGTPRKGTVVKQYEGEPLKFYTIQNGELTKDKKKEGLMYE